MKFHSEREALTLELHDRPFRPMTAPLRVSQLAIATGERGGERDHAQFAALCRRYGKAEPAAGAKHFTVDLGPFTVKWERHTEFSTYTLLREEPVDQPFDETVFDLVPSDWKDGLYGEVMVALHLTVTVDAEEPVDGNRLSRWFAGNPVFGSALAAGSAQLYGDLRTHDDGFERLLLRTSGPEPVLLGQLVQRILELFTYARFAMLSLPIARAASPRLEGIERGLAEVAETLAAAGRLESDEALLERLSGLSAELEDVVAASNYRYGASTAYAEIVENRLRDLQPVAAEGYINLVGYLMRRLTPAMRTCLSVAARQEALSRRANRLSSLLRTGIEVRLEAQNRDLLESMNRRSAQALALQRTVEGLSVVAVSYYAIGLVKIVLEGLSKAGRLGDLSPTVGAALALPLVVAAIWLGLRRLTHRVLEKPRPDGGD
ncbi:hypothetical protein GCM10017083_45520 [Thalassobaculum fulvum]|uniref:DUF3422 domain-containing protein n=1 Tax=Thalassobaculum fulvum TaxID=1633335 RepID=A0A918XVV0_9PROT|nr:DUF3422 domain-containing protein [Thalassobaculum fulvum]GHD60009.1 hypothetical protein GCM10017083_45520 [Thalassobaculum fulvum]